VVRLKKRNLAFALPQKQVFFLAMPFTVTQIEFNDDVITIPNY